MGLRFEEELRKGVHLLLAYLPLSDRSETPVLASSEDDQYHGTFLGSTSFPQSGSLRR